MTAGNEQKWREKGIKTYKALSLASVKQNMFFCNGSFSGQTKLYLMFKLYLDELTFPVRSFQCILASSVFLLLYTNLTIRGIR